MIHQPALVATALLITLGCHRPPLPGESCEEPDPILAVAVGDEDETRVFLVPGADDGLPRPENAVALTTLLPGGADFIGIGVAPDGLVHALTREAFIGPLDSDTMSSRPLTDLCESCSAFRHGPVANGQDWLAIADDGEGASVLWIAANGTTRRTLQIHGSAIHGMSIDEQGRALFSVSGKILRLGPDDAVPIEIYSGVISDSEDALVRNFDYHPQIGFVASGYSLAHPLVWVGGVDPEQWTYDSIVRIGISAVISRITTFMGGRAWVYNYPLQLGAYDPVSGKQQYVLYLEGLVDPATSPAILTATAKRPICEAVD